MAKIGEKTIADIATRVAGLLRHYTRDINSVLERDGTIKIGMPIDLKQEKTGIKIRVGCGFVTERIDDTSTSFVDEQQLDLPLEAMRNCPLQDGETRTEKYCNRICKFRRETIFPEPATGEAHGSFMQYRSCRSWSDDDTHAHVARLLDWEPAAAPPEPEPEMQTFRIRNTVTGKWWEGTAIDAANACDLAGWKEGQCEIKVQNENGAWCKYRPQETATVYKIDKTKKARTAKS